MTIAEAIDSFIVDRESFCSASTVSYYKDNLYNFKSWLLLNGVSQYEQINKTVLKQYLVFLRSRECKNTSIHSYFRAIYAIMAFISREYDFPAVEHIKLPREDPEIIVPLSAGEVDQLLAAVSGSALSTRNKLIIHLMLDCGLRSSEVRNLKFSDVSAEHIIVRNSKYNKSRVLPCPPVVHQLVTQLLPSDTVYVVSDQHGHQLSKNALKQFFQKLKSSSGVQRVHAHLLRHTFATSYMYFYHNLEYLRLYLGHESYDVTQMYLSLSSECLLTDFDIYKIPDCYK